MPRGVPRNRVSQPVVGDGLAVPASSLAVSAVDEPELEPETVAIPTPPVEQTELTDEQRLIRELRNQLALEKGKKDVESELDPVARPGDAANILIHFLEDGLSALGQIWYRGQEIEFEVGSKAYKDTFDRLGRSWLDLRSDDFAQVERWGKVMFRPGPWPGKRLGEVKVQFQPVKNNDGSTVPAPTDEELMAAAAAEAARQRAAPKLQSI